MSEKSVAIEVTQIVAGGVASVSGKFDARTFALCAMCAGRKTGGKISSPQNESAGFGSCQFLTKARRIHEGRPGGEFNGGKWRCS